MAFAEADRLLVAPEGGATLAKRKLIKAADEFIDAMLALDPDTTLDEVEELLREHWPRIGTVAPAAVP